MTERTMLLAPAQTKTVTKVLAFAVVTAVAARAAVPLPGTPVPLALAPMAVVLAGLWLGPAAGAASMALYVLAGAAGLPVFAPTGLPGIARLVGPTGGYLLAYPAAAALTGLIARRFPLTAGRVGAALAGMALIHLGGVAQLTVLTGSASVAVAFGSTPFILLDVAKAFFAGAVAPRGSAKA